MQNGSATWSSPRFVIALVIGAAVIVAFWIAITPEGNSPKPLSQVELKLVGTWKYTTEQFGKNVTITFSKDRAVIHSNTPGNSCPAHWRIDGANLIIEGKIKTMVGGHPSAFIPDAVRRLQLPEAMWHSNTITCKFSFSGNDKLKLTGRDPVVCLIRCALQGNLPPPEGHNKAVNRSTQSRGN